MDGIIKHEGFVYEQDNSDISNDIALVHLAERVNMTREISPICLPGPGAVMPAGTPCFVTGWGDEKGGEVFGSIPSSQKLIFGLHLQETCSPEWPRSSTRLPSPSLTLRPAVNPHTGGKPSDPPWSALGTSPQTS